MESVLQKPAFSTFLPRRSWKSDYVLTMYVYNLAYYQFIGRLMICVTFIIIPILFYPFRYLVRI